MFIKRLQVRARRLGLGRGGGFSRSWHAKNMGRIRSRGKGDRRSIAALVKPRLEAPAPFARRYR
jgi:hypothetical protein